MTDEIVYEWPGIGKLTIRTTGNTGARLRYVPDPDEIRRHLETLISRPQLGESHETSTNTPTTE